MVSGFRIYISIYLKSEGIINLGNIIVLYTIVIHFNSFRDMILDELLSRNPWLYYKFTPSCSKSGTPAVQVTDFDPFLVSRADISICRPVGRFCLVLIQHLWNIGQTAYSFMQRHSYWKSYSKCLNEFKVKF